MQTLHQIHIEDARQMSHLADEQVDLIVTSPPYPMIEMWDAAFSAIDPDIQESLSQEDGDRAFELMHAYLDNVWNEVFRVLKTGGIACINIGDAVRTLDGNFQLYPNHVRIVTKCRHIGLQQLPSIIWRKPTNAPNKFMGSGMLPPAAYVTLEHEYILIFRKHGKRVFDDMSSKQKRRESAYFWEERNQWFSDVWFDLRGTGQTIKEASARNRSGAFPIDLPYRLISMFSIKGDTVLDPFLGTGTTAVAAMCAARNSIGYEQDASLHPMILKHVASAPAYSHELTRQRLEAHATFVEERIKTKGAPKHHNRSYGFPVITRQEDELALETIHNVQYVSSHRFKVVYMSAENDVKKVRDTSNTEQSPSMPVIAAKRGRQLKLF